MADRDQPASQTAIIVCKSTDKLADMSEVLGENAISAYTAGDGSAALSAAKRRPPDYILACRDLPDSSGIKVIQALRHTFPLAAAALFGPPLPLEERRSLIAEGADDYIEVDPDGRSVRTGLERLIARKQIGILGSNEKMLQAIEIVENIARTKVTVLITGESGTGKELIARAIHVRSERREGPFIAVNCGALPEGVLESELFGHEKGSFTGATSQRKGRFEIADGGTLLLDEVGEMPLATQVKLLRVLEEEKFMRVGGSKDVKVDVRVIASTNRDLRRLVEVGHFRRDLYYRLNVVPIHIPPLRERRDDIRTILYGIAEEARTRNHVEFRGMTEEALTALERYDWPGNVRELKNLAESLVVLSGGKKIELKDLPDHIVNRHYTHHDLPVRVDRPREDVERDLLFGRLAEIEHRIVQMTDILVDLRNTLGGEAGPAGQPSAVPGEVQYTEIPDGHDDLAIRAGTPIKEMERDLIEKTLREVDGNRRRAAKLLGIGERTLYRRMKQYGIN